MPRRDDIEVPGESVPDIMALIARAPWREAVTYRDTWPHEYVVVKQDGQQALLAAFCARVARGEGVEGRFFGQTRNYLFLGAHKYWTMTECANIKLEGGTAGRSSSRGSQGSLARAGGRTDQDVHSHTT